MTKLSLKSSLLLLTLALLLPHTLAAKPKQKGLIPSSAGNFQVNATEEMLLYYDVDRDGIVDILTKSISRTTGLASLNVYLWNPALKVYYATGSFPLSSYPNLKNAFISNFNLSPQLILTSYYSDVLGSVTITLQNISCADYQCTLSNPMNVSQLSTNLDPASPCLVTLQGTIAILFHQSGIANVLKLNPDYTYEITPFSSWINGGILPNDFQQTYIGDYDGDCLTDLILMTKSTSSATFQFLKGDLYNSYTPTAIFILPQPAQHFTIQDINFDGHNDLVILLANGDLQIHYNTNTAQTLCQGTPNPYDFQISTTPPAQIQQVALGKAIPPNAVLLFGDYDNDGYDDLALTQLDPVSSLPLASILKNSPCVDAQCGTYNPLFMQESSTLNLRTFSRVNINGLAPVVTRLSFVDIGDDGRLDFIAQCQLNDANGRYLAIQPVYNTYSYDAFFITVTMLAKRVYANQLSNTEYIGACVSVDVTLLSGNLAPRTGNQLSQTGCVLQLPNLRMGLGRTNNYLQNLIVTLPRKTNNVASLQFTWSPIIPNSNIIAIPPPDEPIDDVKTQWMLYMMIEPTDKLATVSILVVVSLAIVGVVILHLTKKQKEQDRENQQSFYTLLR